MNVFANSFTESRAGAAAAVLCAAGALLSAYLSATWLLSSETSFCLTGESCDAVRESRYSSIGGVPVAVLGVLGYASMLAAAFSPLSRRRKWNLLFFLSVAAVSFSAYLTYLEFFVIGAVCSYCVASAAIAVAALALVALRRGDMAPSSSAGKTLAASAVLFALVFAAAYSVHSPSPREESALARSDAYQVSLARWLSDRGATMYGSFRCSHCMTQKELFGKAFGLVPYVECSRDGPGADPRLCASKGIRSYPTWEIDGNFYVGVLPLERLDRISGYSEE